MEKLKLILLLVFVIIYNTGIAGADTSFHLKQIAILSGNFTDFYVDNLNNIYLLTSFNQIKKIDSNGDSVGVFNDVKLYGKILYLDVTNPLKILAYYKDFETIIVLDRFLTIINTIDLRRFGLPEVKAIAQSYDNNIWLYDELNGKLKKIDDKGNVLLESADFRLLFSFAFIPLKIIDNNSQLFLYDDKQGWLEFDYYGAYKKRLNFLNWKDVEVTDKFVTGRDSANLFYADPLTMQLMKVKPGIDFRAVIKIQEQADKFYFLSQNGITIYKIE